jgi:hypothetical protein
MVYLFGGVLLPRAVARHNAVAGLTREDGAPV